MADLTYRFEPLNPHKDWPRPKTAPEERRRRPFVNSDGQISYERTLLDLRHELDHLEASGAAVVQVNLPRTKIRNDGLPYSDAPPPPFPGVILSFVGKYGPLKYYCDACHRWQDNLRAIALTLERLRLAELYGVAKRGEQYTGWRALPPSAAEAGGRGAPLSIDEAATFVVTQAAPLVDHIIDAGVRQQAKQHGSVSVLSDAEMFRQLYRLAARRLHPDANTGSNGDLWKKLQDAADVLRGHHRMAEGV